MRSRQVFQRRRRPDRSRPPYGRGPVLAAPPPNGSPPHRRSRWPRSIRDRLRSAAISSPCGRGPAAGVPVPGCDSSSHPTAETAIATSAIIAMASLVVRVMSVAARPPLRPGRPPGYSDAMAHYGEDATPPGGRGVPRLAASRHVANGCQQIGGRNGFCRLETAPSLVAMVEEVGGRVRVRGHRPAGDDNDRNLRPVLPTIRMVSIPSIPGMKISRKTRSKSPVRHNCTPFRPSSVVTTLCPARSRSRRTVIWTAASSSTTSILAKVKSSPSAAGDQINGKL